jgi:hypothetical protein
VSSSYETAYSVFVSQSDTFVAAERWSFKPVLVSLLIIAAIELVCQLPGSVSFILIPLSLLGYAVALVAVLAMALYFLIKKRPRRGASVLMVFLLPVLLWVPINRAADLVHLGLTVGFGAGQLGAAKSSDSNFAAYDWSVGLAGGPNRFLIHDVTGEIALPTAQRRHPPDFDDGFWEECAGKVRRLAPNYYVCSF